MTENHNDLNSELPQCLTGIYERTNTLIYSDDVTIVFTSSYNTPKKEDRVGDISGYLSYYLKIIEDVPISRYIAMFSYSLSCTTKAYHSEMLFSTESFNF